MKVTSNACYNAFTIVDSEAEQAKKTEQQATTTTKDTVEISSQAAKRSQMELKEQAAQTRANLLKQFAESFTQTESAPQSEDEKIAAIEDPLEKFVRTIMKMMGDRQEIQLKNASEQAERLEEEQAAMDERKEIREENMAEETDAKTSVKDADTAADNTKPASVTPQKGRETLPSAYGKKGAPIGKSAVDTNSKSGYSIKA